MGGGSQPAFLAEPRFLELRTHVLVPVQTDFSPADSAGVVSKSAGSSPRHYFTGNVIISFELPLREPPSGLLLIMC